MEGYSIHLENLADSLEKNKASSFAKYFSYLILAVNIIAFFFTVILILFSKHTAAIFDPLVQATLIVSIVGTFSFFVFRKLSATKLNFIFTVQFLFVLFYFFIAAEYTGGISNPSFAFVYLFILIAGFYALHTGALTILAAYGYAIYQEIFLNGTPADMFLAENGWSLILMFLIFALSLYLGEIYRKTLKEEVQFEKYVKDMSADKSKDEAIISNIADGIYAINMKKEIILFNKAAEKITGWTSKDAIGSPCKSVMNIKDPESVSVCEKNCPVNAVWAKGQNSFRNDMCIINKRKENIQVEGSYTPIKEGNGKITGAICVFRDITKRKELERMQSEFVSTASHEMRTPITAVSGYIELVLNQNICKIDEKAREYLGKALRTTSSMSNLIKNLLVVTKIEDRKLDIKVTNFSLEKLIKEVIDVLQKKALEGNNALKYETAPNLTIKGKKIGRSLNVRADEEQIREVLYNLVENAIKFTKDGEVKIAIDYDNEFAKVCVSDTGVGIPEGEINHLFEKFYQVDNSATRNVGGSGLGLYITRSIVESFGGKIWVESKPGTGSKFCFTVPRSVE